MPVSSKELLDIASAACRFTIKRICDMIRSQQLKNVLSLHNYFIHSIHSQGILFIWSEKSFLSFKLFTTAPQEKSCLRNWFTIFHVVTEEILSPTVFVTQWTSTDYCKTSDFFFWLIFKLTETLFFLFMDEVQLPQG